MLHKLENSGLPIYRDDETGKLALEAPLTYKGFAEKTLSQMKGLFADDSGNDPNENIYDVYRGIMDPKDEELFQTYDYQYDITVVKSGNVGMERKKTSGHYHSYNEMRTYTIPEVYEVLEGTALFVLQRADNFEDTDYENLDVSDLIIARVEAGQAIIVPPNYGHCSVNGGEGDLIFSNLAYVPCRIDYAPVQYYHGLGVYVDGHENEIQTIVNGYYNKLPKAKLATVKENAALGILFHHPVYQEFKKRPEAFTFLGNVDAYVEDIMSMLDIK